MCTFIIAVVPPDAQMESLKAELEAHRLGFRAFEEAEFQEQLPPGDTAFYTTYGFCDCGTELGSGNARDQQEQKQQAIEAKEEMKRRKKGWSEPKLARWRADRQAQQEKLRQQEIEQGRGGLECLRWVHLLDTVLSHRIASRISVFILNYNQTRPYPPFKTMAHVRVRQADIMPEYLRFMQEHTLYEFGP